MIEPAHWPVPPSIVAGVTSRLGGHSLGVYEGNNLSFDVGDDPVAVDVNRKQLSDTFDAHLSWSWLKQVHGIEVLRLPCEGELVADAVFSLQSNQVCSVMTADCLPILLTDKKAQFVAAIHAGWRSLAAGIVEKTLSKIHTALSAEGNFFDPSQVLAWMGPAISQDYFEVGEDVRSAFLAEEPEKSSEAFMSKGQGKYQANIFLLGEMRLRRLGVERIYSDHQCTFFDQNRFYSYRRDGQTGRMVSFIYKQA